MTEVLLRNDQTQEAANWPLFLIENNETRARSGQEMFDYTAQFDAQHEQFIKHDVVIVAFLQLRDGELKEPDYLADAHDERLLLLADYEWI